MAKAKNAIRPHSGRKGKDTLLFVLLKAFAGGVGACLLLMAIFAVVLSNTPVPLTLVRPLACLAAAAGASASGLLLARKMGKQLLLCGLGCGVFYSVCQIVAASIVNDSLPMRSADWMLPAALLLGGTLGGTLAALRREH